MPFRSNLANNANNASAVAAAVFRTRVVRVAAIAPPHAPRLVVSAMCATAEASTAMVLPLSQMERKKEKKREHATPITPCLVYSLLLSFYSRVESKPSQPQDQAAQRRQRQAVARHGLRVGAVLSNARAEEPGTDQAGPATDRVDGRAAGKVLEKGGWERERDARKESRSRR